MAGKKRPVGRPKGIPRAETAGRKKGSGEKTERFLTYRVSPTENKNLNYILDTYTKKYNLRKNEAVKKIFFEIAKLENIDFEEI